MILPQAFSLLFLLAASPQADPLVALGKLADASIDETSGIVKSHKHTGIFWIESDSGNPATIHAIRDDGRVVGSFPIAAANIDWEEIAADNDGHLYLADTGNNGLRLPVRVIYRIDEPDPARKPTGKVAISQAYYYQFASKDKRFDAEALIIDKTSVYLIEKRRDGIEPAIYCLDMEKPGSLLKPAIPVLVSKVPAFIEPVTGCSFSADGTRLAVVSTTVCRIYDWREGGRLTLLATIRYKERHFEAIAWDGLDLIMATEPGELFRLTEATWKK